MSNLFMQRKLVFLLLVLAFSVGTYLSFISVVAAATDADFYKGKTLTIVAGFDTGGSYDFDARIAARHLGEELPGNPNVIVSNMPGAGSIKAANYLYKGAAQDGTVLGVLTQAIAVEQSIGNTAVRYDASKFHWVGRISDNVDVTVVWHTAPVKTIDDVKKVQTVLSATSPAGASAQFPTILNRTAETKFKVITGYKGTNGAMLAMERGEVDGSHSSWATLKTQKPEWLRDKTVRILVQYAPYRLPDLADVPCMVELAAPGPLRSVSEFFASTAKLGRALMAPPGVPPERVKVLRAAFEEMVKSKSFLADIEKSRADLRPLDGPSLQKLVEEVVATPSDITKLAKEIQTVHGGAE